MSSIRFLLFPFSILYGAGVLFRNKLFDWNIRKSVSFELPVVTVGNLSVGGTGKTPHVEYLIRMLEKKYMIGVLSRGYKRKTKGYLLVNENLPASASGDEPLQIKKKFPRTTVAVCEDRVLGIPNMLADNPDLQVILLDDAFQHRKVRAGLTILLTEYSKPYSRDHLLPSGKLRESKDGAYRADVIIVTKCPQDLSGKQKKDMEKELQLGAAQKIFFSFFQYGMAYNIYHPELKMKFTNEDQLLLICGIADPELLLAELQKVSKVQMIRFHDHHRYSLKDLEKIDTAFNAIDAQKKHIVTTEKDAVRLNQFKDWLSKAALDVYAIPVEVNFSEEEKKSFDQLICSFAEKKLAEYNGRPAE